MSQVNIPILNSLFSLWIGAEGVYGPAAPLGRAGIRLSHAQHGQVITSFDDEHTDVHP